MGRVTGSLANRANRAKFVADVAVRLLANQIVRMGIRGDKLDGQKLILDAISRAITYSGSDSVIKFKIRELDLKLDMIKCFSRAALKSLNTHVREAWEW